MTYNAKEKLEEYSKILNEKVTFLNQLRITFNQTSKEIDLLTGAVQALTEVVKSSEKINDTTNPVGK
jgi:hypothetical protein